MLGLKSRESVLHSGQPLLPSILIITLFWGNCSLIHSNEGWQSSPFPLLIRVGNELWLASSVSFFRILKIGNKGVEILAPLVAELVECALQIANDCHSSFVDIV